MALSPDMLERLRPKAQGMQLSLMAFLQHPDAGMLQQHGGGAHGFLGLQGVPLLASCRDPWQPEYDPKPANARGCHVRIHSGTKHVTPAQHMAVVRALRPDMYVCLADDVTLDTSRKRAEKSVSRTVQWIDDSMPLHQQQVVGASFADLRTRCADAVAQRHWLAGFALSGLGLGESMQQRRSLLAACLDCLPANKFRFLTGADTPLEVLDAVELGIDLFDTRYLQQLSERSQALVFPIPDPAAVAPDAAAAADERAGCGCYALDMTSEEHRTDTRPILEGCSCHACSNGYSRSYIHHLVAAKELLAKVLLEHHNSTRYQLFFQAMQQAIASDRLPWLRAHIAAVQPPLSSSSEGSPEPPAGVANATKATGEGALPLQEGQASSCSGRKRQHSPGRSEWAL